MRRIFQSCEYAKWQETPFNRLELQIVLIFALEVIWLTKSCGRNMNMFEELVQREGKPCSLPQLE